MNIDEEKKPAGTIYTEAPGTDENNGMKGKLSKPNAETSREALEKLEQEKEQDKKEVIKKEDTSGEAG